MKGLATSKEVAAYLGVHPQSMDRWASEGRGPRYTKVEGNRRYDWADIKDYVDGGKVSADGPRWTCSRCRRPVNCGGYLITSIDHAVLNGDADWGIFHDECERPDVPNPYLIEIERALTWPQLADWIAHLWEKEWAHATNLDNLLRKAGARS